MASSKDFVFCTVFMFLSIVCNSVQYLYSVPTSNLFNLLGNWLHATIVLLLNMHYLTATFVKIISRKELSWTVICQAITSQIMKVYPKLMVMSQRIPWTHLLSVITPKSLFLLSLFLLTVLMTLLLTPIYLLCQLLNTVISILLSQLSTLRMQDLSSPNLMTWSTSSRTPE